MKVSLSTNSKIKLFFCRIGKHKDVYIASNDFSSKLSSILPNPTATILLVRLPWLDELYYRDFEHSLAYRLPNGAVETIFDVDNEILEILNKYDEEST